MSGTSIRGTTSEIVPTNYNPSKQLIVIIGSILDAMTMLCEKPPKNSSISADVCYRNQFVHSLSIFSGDLYSPRQHLVPRCRAGGGVLANDHQISLLRLLSPTMCSRGRLTMVYAGSKACKTASAPERFLASRLMLRMIRVEKTG